MSGIGDAFREGFDEAFINVYLDSRQLALEVGRRAALAKAFDELIVEALAEYDRRNWPWWKRWLRR